MVDGRSEVVKKIDGQTDAKKLKDLSNQLNDEFNKDNNPAQDQFNNAQKFTKQLEEQGILPEVLMGAFSIFDADNDGILSKAELTAYENSDNTKANPLYKALAQEFERRFDVIEAADNEKWNLGAGEMDGKAGMDAVAAFLQLTKDATYNNGVLKTPDGKIIEIRNPEDSITSFQYATDGSLLKVANSDGTVYLKNGYGTWDVYTPFQDGMSYQNMLGPEKTPAKIELSANGDLKITFEDGISQTQTADGRTTRQIDDYEAYMSATKLLDTKIDSSGKSLFDYIDNCKYGGSNDAKIAAEDIDHFIYWAENDKNGDFAKTVEKIAEATGKTPQEVLDTLKNLRDNSSTYLITKEAGSISFSMNDKVVVAGEDGTVLVKGLSGRLNTVEYSDHTSSSIIYNDMGLPAEYLLKDGRKLTFNESNSNWVDQDGKTYSNVLASENGQVVIARDIPGSTAKVMEYINLDGSIDSNPQTNTSQAQLNQAALKERAEKLYDAFHGNAINADFKTIIAGLEGMTAADRLALAQIYQNEYKVSLTAEPTRLSPGDAAQAEALLLKKGDGGADDSGSINAALKMISNPNLYEHQRGEQLLVNYLASMNAEQIAQLNEQYKKQFGVSLKEAIDDNPQLSAGVRQVADIYLQGMDKISDKDESGKTWFKTDVAAQLMKYALESKNVMLLGDVVSHVTSGDRDAFFKINNIESYFSGDELALAKDYAAEGRIRLTSIVDGSLTWVLHRDRDAIGVAMLNASQDEKEQFKAGEILAQKIADNKLTEADVMKNPKDVEALKFYRDLDSTLRKWSGDNSTWEAIAWEDQLMRNGSIISTLRKLELTQTLGIGGCYHDRGDVMEALENMSAEDIKRLKEDPSFRKDLDAFLSSMMGGKDGAEYLEAQGIINGLLNDAKRPTSGRTIEQIINENSWDSLIPGQGRYEPADIVNALLKLSPADQAKYMTDKDYQNKINALVEDRIDDGPAKELIKGILKHYLTEGSGLQGSALLTALYAMEPFNFNSLSPVEKVWYLEVAQTKKDAGITNNQILDAVVQAMNTPEVKAAADRIKAGNGTQDDIQLLNSLVEATNKAENTFFSSYSEIVQSAKENADAMKDSTNIAFSIFAPKDGVANIPLETMLALCRSDSERLTVVQQLNEAELKKFNQVDSYKNQILDNFSGSTRELVQKLLENAKFSEDGKLAPRPEDILRACALGLMPASTAEKTLQDLTAKMEPDAAYTVRVALMNQYAADYGSGAADLKLDLLKAVPTEERTKIEFLLATTKTEQRQAYFDMMHEALKSLDAGTAGMVGSSEVRQVMKDMDTFLARMEDAAGGGKPLTDEEITTFCANLTKSLEQLKHAKEGFAEGVVELTITLAAMTAAAIATVATGGLAAPAILAIAGLCATIKVAGKSYILGNDYDANNWWKDAVSGGISGALNVLGPELAGKFLGLGANVAADVLGALPASIVTDLTENTIKTGVQEIVMKALVTGAKDLDQVAFKELAETLIKQGVKMSENELVDLLKKEVLNTIKLEGRTFLEKLAVEVMVNSATGAGAGGVGGGSNALMNWDSSKPISENLANIALMTSTGALFGAGGGAVFTLGFKLGSEVTAPITGLIKQGVNNAATAVKDKIIQAAATITKNETGDITLTATREITVNVGNDVKLLKPGESMHLDASVKVSIEDTRTGIILDTVTPTPAKPVAITPTAADQVAIQKTDSGVKATINGKEYQLKDGQWEVLDSGGTKWVPADSTTQGLINKAVAEQASAEFLRHLPAEMTAPLKGKGVTVESYDDIASSPWKDLANEKVPGQPDKTFADVGAFYDPKTSKIVLLKNNITSTEQLNKIIIEEVGHALDHIYGISTRSSDWKVTFGTEKVGAKFTTRDLELLNYQSFQNSATGEKEAAAMAISIVFKKENGLGLTEGEAAFDRLFPNTVKATKAELARAGVIEPYADMPTLSPLKPVDNTQWQQPIATDALPSNKLDSLKWYELNGGATFRAETPEGTFLRSANSDEVVFITKSEPAKKFTYDLDTNSFRWNSQDGTLASVMTVEPNGMLSTRTITYEAGKPVTVELKTGDTKILIEKLPDNKGWAAHEWDKSSKTWRSREVLQGELTLSNNLRPEVTITTADGSFVFDGQGHTFHPVDWPNPEAQVVIDYMDIGGRAVPEGTPGALKSVYASNDGFGFRILADGENFDQQFTLTIFDDKGNVVSRVNANEIPGLGRPSGNAAYYDFAPDGMPELVRYEGTSRVVLGKWEVVEINGTSQPVFKTTDATGTKVWLDGNGKVLGFELENRAYTFDPKKNLYSAGDGASNKVGEAFLSKDGSINFRQDVFADGKLIGTKITDLNQNLLEVRRADGTKITIIDGVLKIEKNGTSNILKYDELTWTNDMKPVLRENFANGFTETSETGAFIRGMLTTKEGVLIPINGEDLKISSGRVLRKVSDDIYQDLETLWVYDRLGNLTDTDAARIRWNDNSIANAEIGNSKIQRINKDTYSVIIDGEKPFNVTGRTTVDPVTGEITVLEKSGLREFKFSQDGKITVIENYSNGGIHSIENIYSADYRVRLNNVEVGPKGEILNADIATVTSKSGTLINKGDHNWVWRDANGAETQLKGWAELDGETGQLTFKQIFDDGTVQTIAFDKTGEFKDLGISQISNNPLESGIYKPPSREKVAEVRRLYPMADQEFINTYVEKAWEVQVAVMDELHELKPLNAEIKQLGSQYDQIRKEALLNLSREKYAAYNSGDSAAIAEMQAKWQALTDAKTPEELIPFLKDNDQISIVKQYAEKSAEYETKLEPVRKQLEDFINSMNDDIGHPRITLNIDDDIITAGNFNHRTGVITIRTKDLLNGAESPYDLFGLMVHENTHNEQFDIIYRRLLDDIENRTGKPATYEEFVIKYQEVFGKDSAPEKQYIDQVIKNRDGNKLNETYTNYADKLIEAELNYVGGGDHFDPARKLIKQELEALAGDPTDRKTIMAIFGLLQGRNDNALFELNFQPLDSIEQPWVAKLKQLREEYTQFNSNKTMSNEDVMYFQKELTDILTEAKRGFVERNNAEKTLYYGNELEVANIPQDIFKNTMIKTPERFKYLGNYRLEYSGEEVTHFSRAPKYDATGNLVAVGIEGTLDQSSGKYLITMSDGSTSEIPAGATFQPGSENFSVQMGRDSAVFSPEGKLTGINVGTDIDVEYIGGKSFLRFADPLARGESTLIEGALTYDKGLINMSTEQWTCTMDSSLQVQTAKSSQYSFQQMNTNGVDQVVVIDNTTGKTAGTLTAVLEFRNNQIVVATDDGRVLNLDGEEVS